MTQFRSSPARGPRFGPKFANRLRAIAVWGRFRQRCRRRLPMAVARMLAPLVLTCGTVGGYASVTFRIEPAECE